MIGHSDSENLICVTRWVSGNDGASGTSCLCLRPMKTISTDFALYSLRLFLWAHSATWFNSASLDWMLLVWITRCRRRILVHKVTWRNSGQVRRIDDVGNWTDCRALNIAGLARSCRCWIRNEFSTGRLNWRSLCTTAVTATWPVTSHQLYIHIYSP